MWLAEWGYYNEYDTIADYLWLICFPGIVASFNIGVVLSTILIPLGFAFAPFIAVYLVYNTYKYHGTSDQARINVQRAEDTLRSKILAQQMRNADEDEEQGFILDDSLIRNQFAI